MCRARRWPAIALAGGIHADLLFKWRRDHLRSMRLGAVASSASAVLVPVEVTPGVSCDVGNSQPFARSSASTSVPEATRRVLRGTGVIELDIAGAVLRLRGPVDETSPNFDRLIRL